VLKVSELLDKLIEAEQFIKDLTEKLESMEKENQEARQLDEQIC
jgi:hypothetical protein